MRYKRVISIIFFVMAIFAITGCNLKKLKEIRATSWSLESVSLRGLRSLQADLALELENPSVKVTLTDITGILYHKGVPYINYRIDPITIDGKSTKTYNCSCILELDATKSILDVLAALPEFNPSEVTTDISAKAVVSGFKKSFAFNNVPVKRFLKK